MRPLLLFEPLSGPCSLNDLNSDEISPHSDQSVEAALIVNTDGNVFVDNDVGEEESTSNKVKEATGLYIKCIMCQIVIAKPACRASQIVSLKGAPAI